MSKIKNLSDLGDLYSQLSEVAAKQPIIESGNKQPDILNTDTSMYLSESTEGKMVKPGSALGGGPGVKEEGGSQVTPPWPKSGPKAAGGFKKDEAKDKQDAVEETEMEKEEMKAAEKNEEKEKIEENVDSASKTPKYNKQTFTMPKSKFQKLYEDAINAGPFQNVNEEEEAMTPVEPAADAGAEEIGAEPEVGGEEECCTHEEAIEMVEKLLQFLKKDTAYDKAHGDLGDEDQAFTHGGEEDGEESPIAEDVEAEDMGHTLVNAKSEELKDGHKIHKVGSLKQKGKASFEGGPKGQDGAVAKAPESSHLKDGHKLHTAGDLKVDKGQSNAFEQ